MLMSIALSVFFLCAITACTAGLSRDLSGVAAAKYVLSRSNTSLTFDDLSTATCRRYLETYMPSADRGPATNVTSPFLNQVIAMALETRDRFDWAEAIPTALFLNEVLPYRMLSEPIDVSWRAIFYQYFFNTLRLDTDANLRKNMTAAVLAILEATWRIDTPPVVFVGAPPDAINAYSPWEVLLRGNSSCTGLAELLVAAMRSAGVPARVAGTPHWNKGAAACPKGDASPPCGNHNWVEVWIHTLGWTFLSPGDAPKLNVGWFYPLPAKDQVFGTTNHSIFASSFAPPSTLPAELYPFSAAAVPGHFPLAFRWSDHSVNAWDVTKRYLQ